MLLQDINIWAVLVAALSVFVLGGIWYSPTIFGSLWQREAYKEQVKCEKGHSPAVYIWSLILSLVAASAFAIILGPQPSLKYSIYAGVVIGFAWVATSFGMNYLFAGRSLKLFLIDGGYHLVQFIIYGIILGLWH